MTVSDHHMNRVLERFDSLPSSVRQDVFDEMKERSPSTTHGLSPKHRLAKAAKTLTRASKMALTGLLALCYLYLLYQTWESAGLASLRASELTQKRDGNALLYTPANDLKKARSAFMALQEQMRVLPPSLQSLSKKEQDLSQKISEKKAECEYLQDVITNVQLYESHDINVLPAHIQRDLNKIMLGNILHKDLSSPTTLRLQGPQDHKLLLQGQKKQAPTALAVMTSNLGVALTTQESQTVQAWYKEWEHTGPLVKDSMYRGLVDNYLKEKRALWKGASETTALLEKNLETIVQQKKGKEERLAMVPLQTRDTLEQIQKRKLHVVSLKKKFDQQVARETKVLADRRLEKQGQLSQFFSFSSTEYAMMSECLLLCTMMAATTGPLPLMRLFSSGFNEWFMTVTAMTGLVMKQGWRGNLVTFGSLLMEVFGISMNFLHTDRQIVSFRPEPKNFDQTLFLTVLVAMTITFFGYYGVLLLMHLWGVDNNQYKRELARVKKEYQDFRKAAKAK